MLCTDQTFIELNRIRKQRFYSRYYCARFARLSAALARLSSALASESSAIAK